MSEFAPTRPQFSDQTVALLADSDVARRNALRALLVVEGYFVLSASTADEISNLSLKFADEIHLLVADRKILHHRAVSEFFSSRGKVKAICLSENFSLPAFREQLEEIPLATHLYPLQNRE